MRNLGTKDCFNRELYSLCIASLEDFPKDLKLPSKHFVVCMVCDAQGASDSSIRTLARLLVEQGTAYFCAWGPNCERMHDLFDQEAARMHPQATAESVIMTTWHNDESLEGAIWDFLHCTVPAQNFLETCRAVLLVSVGNDDWAAKIESVLTSAAAFSKPMIEKEGAHSIQAAQRGLGALVHKMNLQTQVEELYARETKEFGDEYFRAFDEFKQALNEGRVRAAEPDRGSPTGWRVNPWVKKGILLGFRIGRIVEMGIAPPFSGATAGPACGTGATEEPQPQTAGGPLQNQFRDKHTFPLKQLPRDQNIRIVPGGSSIRDGCYIGKNVTCMPPMYVNVGAYVDDGAMIDSHALVGSCAQVGKRVHLSAAAQIGGVLEPIGAMPVIVEDDVLVGGNCGVYEGTIVGKGTVLAAGAILTGSTPVYDLVRDAVYRREGEKPLMIPPGAVVVPGARAITKGQGKELGLSLYTPVIIKYRDEKTDQAVRLEELLR